MKAARRLTVRERWLLALIPAALLALAYRWFVVPEMQTVERLEGLVGEARATAPADATLADRRRERDDQFEAVEALELQLEELRDELKEAVPGGARNSVAVQIDRWRQHLEAHQLQLIGTQMQRRPAADGTTGQGPALEIRFYGEWHAARRAFAETDALPPAWTPSSLRMAEPQGGSTRRLWTMVVRIGEVGA